VTFNTSSSFNHSQSHNPKILSHFAGAGCASRRHTRDIIITETKKFGSLDYNSATINQLQTNPSNQRTNQVRSDQVWSYSCNISIGISTSVWEKAGKIYEAERKNWLNAIVLVCHLDAGEIRELHDRKLPRRAVQLLVIFRKLHPEKLEEHTKNYKNFTTRPKPQTKDPSFLGMTRRGVSLSSR